MGCNCGRRKKSPIGNKNIVDQYKYLRPHQIRSRLEIFKKNFCADCVDRYKCNYTIYITCTKRPQGGNLL